MNERIQERVKQNRELMDDYDYGNGPMYVNYGIHIGW